MKFDIVIIGGGIVGLATALKLKNKNEALKIAVLEKEAKPAQHQTGHNSGVIHSGLYYKPGSLKAKNCIDGYNQLIRFCDENDVKYELCGKVVVATREQELPFLKTLLERGSLNGLNGLKNLNVDELREYEPHVNGIAGIFVPQTGIIDYSAVTNKYLENFKKLGGKFFPNEKVIKINYSKGQTEVITNNKTYTSKLLVNCAGLYSDEIARMTGMAKDLQIIPFRGEYYELKKEASHLVKNLIYPVPDPAFPFLGVHFTRMINGGIEAGPNAVLAFAKEGYTKRKFNVGELMNSLLWPGFQKVAWKYWQTGMGEMYRSFSKAAFTKALQRLLPELKEEDLITGGAGVRAQACDRNGGLLDDFVILENEFAINVCNAPSPAATSSLAIGDTVSELVLARID
ncbi:MAG: L-2-hydroxyglutarate oxidase [Candidatus Cyclobacteriaceae bacterium M2_1C_046]